MKRIAEGFELIGLTTLDKAPMTNVETGAIRPPLSVHRLGGRSTILSHSVQEGIKILEAKQYEDSFKRLARALPRPRSRRRQPLRPPAGTPPETDRVPQKVYASGSEEAAAVALSVVNRDGTFQDFGELVVRRSSESVRLLDTLDKHREHGDLDRWLRRTWRSGQEYAATNPPTGRAHASADHEVLASWTPRLTAVDLPHDAARGVATLLHQEAQARGRAMVGMSCRVLAEKSNSSRGSVGRGREWLLDHNVVEIAGEHDARTATRYRLVHADSWRTDTGVTVSPPSVGGVRGLTVPGLSQPRLLAENQFHDVWCPRGLGEKKRLTYLAVASGEDESLEVHVTTVAIRTGVTRRTAERHLKALNDVGLVRGLGDGLWAAEYRDPAELAVELGVAGHQQALVTRHEQERREDAIRQVISRLRRDDQRQARRSTQPAPPGNQNHSQIWPSPVSISPARTTRPAPLDTTDAFLALPPFHTKTLTKGDAN
jgi:DNA-binding transcriptional ArsR family regulator